MPIIPKPQFPNVPKLPGVPQLPRSPSFPAGPPPIVGLAVAFGRLWQSLHTQPQWAIYKHTEPTEIVGTRLPLVQPDSFLEFGYINESTVSDYPVQAGEFSSYDKVANPFEISLRMSKGGSKQSRKKFLDDIEAITDTLDLYDILTPERTYLAVNVLRYTISRKGNRDAYFFAEVDLYFREIRQVTATYSKTATVVSNPQDPSAKSAENTGVLQGQKSALTPQTAGVPVGL